MADLLSIRLFLLSYNKKGRSLLNILSHHFGGVVNIPIYLQLFQDLLIKSARWLYNSALKQDKICPASRLNCKMAIKKESFLIRSKSED